MTHPLAQLDALRRVDWRFLFHPEVFGDVAYYGQRDAQLEESLLLISKSVRHVDRAASEEVLGPAFDLVVLRNPDESAVAQAVRVLKPDGRLYVELSRGVMRGARRTRSLKRLVRMLERLGLEGIEAQWHFPNLARRDGIVQLADSAALRVVFDRAPQSRSGRIRALLGRRLLDLGKLDLFVPDVSAIARRPAPTPTTEAGWPLRRLRSFPAASEVVLLTPRDRSSKCVVSLVIPAEGSVPAVVAKQARLAAFAPRLQREASNLRAAEEIRDDGIPRLVALEELDGYPVLVQTAVTGTPLDPPTVRRGGLGSVEPVLEWLNGIREASLALGGHAPFERLVASPLRRFEEAFSGSSSPALLSATHDLLEPLQRAVLPATLEHGDLSHPNILQLGDGRIGVVDWELAEVQGMPTHDLFFFLTYVAFARAGARRRRVQLRAFDEAFIRPGWATPYVLAYARRAELDPALLTPLLVACWMRYTTGLLPRIGEADDTRVVDDPAASTYIDRSWYRAIWEHVVARANRFEWAAR